jgi:hypothetical protein
VAAMLTRAFQHPMCHTEKFSTVRGLFQGFRNEVFSNAIFAAVEICAASKRMTNESLKKFHLLLRSHKRTELNTSFFASQKISNRHT